MATRPIFLPTNSGDQLFDTQTFSFSWNPGFAESQKRKNIHELHRAAGNAGLGKVLEISTKSEDEIGRRLSAFNLKYRLEEKTIPLECIYQGSKVFADAGPFDDLFNLTARECKADPRLRSSGEIVYFLLEGDRYDSKPANAFYDWIYIRCLNQHEDFLRRRLSEYEGFSDIEFNPERSINCQARALAVLISLSARGKLQLAAGNFQYFREVMAKTFSSL
ncbi:hypothetical protein FJ986_06695 [Mesorhizobium sp. B1-1-1]|uniref:DarT1-associated NADAR antitoxin family protein n=1 Tax=Mesorhizobium sp. B1-1-1 TaxID=2589983 RepID=UPI00112DEC65|nr:hypothetical protein [Mesorhizobium sp. B1-1-1]TPN69027.1 hypothetical protein FJ986_06695 [Mesorhizobium sp. B1-1-1]